MVNMALAYQTLGGGVIRMKSSFIDIKPSSTTWNPGVCPVEPLCIVAKKHFESPTLGSSGENRTIALPASDSYSNINVYT
jgi:hypothetical protein